MTNAAFANYTVEELKQVVADYDPAKAFDKFRAPQAIAEIETEVARREAEEEASYRAQMDAEMASPSLRAMERAGDLGPIPYSGEAFDEMVRQDMEGLS